MARRRRLTDAQVESLPTKGARYTYPDPELPGHYVRIYPTGKRSFVTVKDNVWTTIGDTRTWTIEKAREKARCIRRNEAAPESIEDVAERYRNKQVAKLRSARTVERYLDRLKREFAGRDFASIKRSELANLADKIAETSGSRTAEYMLMTFSALSRWYALRHEDYNSPVVPGMTKEFRGKARERILSDDELRAVWKEAERRGDNFGVLIRLLLLTGQRREKVASMKWTHLDGAVWQIETAEREKKNGGMLVLPQAAVDIINAQVRMGSNPFVLAARAGSHISAFNRLKAAFDKASCVSDWRLHDLRRTARSLMSRAGVRPDIAERVLGHTIKGVEGVYDRHTYEQEKAHALEALSRQITSIVDPPAGNVTPIRKVG